MKVVKMTNIAGVFTALALALLTAPFASCAKKEAKIDFGNGVSIGIVEIPGNNFCITKTEITQDVYQAVTGQNPSKEKGDKFPVESVSWYDAIVFCNKLSAIQQKSPCYSVNGSTNPDDWGYLPHQNQKIEGKIDFDPSADGYRIPTLDEWDVAIRGGEKYKYSGSDDLDSVAWTDCNSGGKLHQVAQLKPNAFGIYDMSGNVFEWVWSERNDGSRYYCGGSFFDAARAGKCNNKELNYASGQFKSVGFRVTWNKPQA